MNDQKLRLLSNVQFTREVAKALRMFYRPGELAASPLANSSITKAATVVWKGSEASTASAALQTALRGAVEQTAPRNSPRLADRSSSNPLAAGADKRYRTRSVLRHVFTAPQPEMVADGLGEPRPNLYQRLGFDSQGQMVPDTLWPSARSHLAVFRSVASKQMGVESISKLDCSELRISFIGNEINTNGARHPLAVCGVFSRGFSLRGEQANGRRIDLEPRL